MKSIRLSLIVYFLLLLVAAESVAFWLVYQSAGEALREKQAINHELIENQFRKAQDDERHKFDADLWDQAKDVATHAILRSQWDALSTSRLLALGMMSDVQAHMGGPIWIAEQTPARFGMPTLRGHMQMVLLTTLTQVALPDEVLPKSATGETEYFQINTEWARGARPWRSKSLGDEVLPFTSQEFGPTDFFEPKYENLILANNVHVRRVMLKVSANPLNPGRGGPRGPRPNPGGPRNENRPPQNPPPPRPQPPRDRSGESNAPWIVIHVARPPASISAALARLEEEKKVQLATLDDDARDSLAALRRRLLAIGVGTVVATALGGLLLVGYGLSPLKRLSDAVSRVSASDFRLPLDGGKPLPRELAPIRARIEHTLDDLRRAFEREKQASADISHELRTPVASLLTTVEVALRKPRSAEEYRRVLDECRGIGRQMRQLVERIMALSRLDAGSDRVRPQAVNVNDLVTETAALVRPLAVERGLDLRVQCPKPVTITTDPDKLREVLVNLLHNAVQYNKPNGSVDVAAEQSDGWLDLRVHDTGIGIQPEAFGRIFERFYREDASRHADDLHAGLGLSIVKGYVGLLGGSIRVESRPGHGSTFHVRLPAA